MRPLRLAIVGVCLLPMLAAGETAKPSVHLLVANPPSEVKVSTDRRQFAYETLIQSDVATKSAGVRAFVTPLTGPTRITPGCTIDGQPCSQPFDIDPMQSRTLKLTADLVAPGVYSMIISIISGTDRQSVTLTVTRTLTPPLPVKVLSTAKVEGESGASLSLRVNLQETEGIERTLNSPEMIDIARLGKLKERVQAHFDRVQAFDNRNNELTGPWKISAGGPTPVRIDLYGLDDPGEYSGTVRFSTPEAQLVDVPLTITVRRSWLIAAVLIALGVFLSYLLHSIVALTPWLAQQEKAATVAADLEQLVKEVQPVEDEKRVATAVAGRVDALFRTLDGGKRDASVDAALDVLDHKVNLLRNWIAARRQVNTLPSAVAAQVRTIIDDVATALTNSGLTVDDAVAAEKKLNGLDAAIVTARTAAAVKAIIDDLRQRLQQPAPAGFTNAEWKTLQDRVTPLLDGAASKKGDASTADARAALALFVGTAAAKLGALATKSRLMIESNAQLVAKPDEQKALHDRATKLETASQEITKLTAEGNVDAASAAYTAAVQELAAIKAAVAVFGVNLGAADAAVPAAAPAASALPDKSVDFVVAMLLPRFRRERRNPGFWRGLISGLSGFVLLVALVVAVASGLRLLWVDNYTWGSFSDGMIAILWGLGMHQVSGNAFEGIPALVAKFK